MNRWTIVRILGIAVLALAMPGVAAAQRELQWDDFDVTAHLDASGSLHVVETQTMRFTGAWNGGERRFNIRPRQKMSFAGISRNSGGGWAPMSLDDRLDTVDDYAWTGRNTLRWRSRLPSDAPFDRTAIGYELRYVLSGILLKEGDGYVLDHDFAFPDRDGIIYRFVLRLTLDPSWQPMSDVRDVYRASRLPPGESFVLKVPLRHTGATVPVALDRTRPREVVIAVATLLAVAGLGIALFLWRESSYGRFAPVPAGAIDESWLREHVLRYPAEVVGAAWDDSVGTSEIVALIARMVAEGKLESDVAGHGSAASMSLRLKVDRKTLEGHERTLVEGLFVDGRTDTSPDLVKAHYQEVGFNPADAIRPELESTVQQLVPAGDPPRVVRFPSRILTIAGAGVLLVAWYLEDVGTSVALFGGLGLLILGGIGLLLGAIFRNEMQWGRKAAVLCLIPALTISLAVAIFLWFFAGPGTVALPSSALMALVALAVGLTISSINALKSRQHPARIAFRKRLAAGRAFFAAELQKEHPAFRDEWYPWALAFGLGAQVDDWSTRQPVQHEHRRRDSRRDSSRDFESTPSIQSTHTREPWGGFGGGRSGGAGASGSWAAAASTMAVAVPAPRRSSSSDYGGGSSDSSGGDSGGSSSGGSSGGGGGGGW